MSDMREVFMEAIRKTPRDKAPRLIFADWLNEHDCPEESDFHRLWTVERYDVAEAWMREFANKCGDTCVENYGHRSETKQKWEPITYEKVMAVAQDCCNEYAQLIASKSKKPVWTMESCFTQVGDEGARNGYYQHKKEFWENFSIITGLMTTEEHEEIHVFSCTC